VSLFHVGATTTAERGLSLLGGGGLSKSVALTWNEWTTGWRREKVTWRNRSLRLTKKSPAPVLHSPEGRPGNVHITIPTPTGSLDEATTFRPPQCVGQKLAGSGTGVVPSESEAKVVEIGEEFLKRHLVWCGPVEKGECSAPKDGAGNSVGTRALFGTSVLFGSSWHVASISDW
jgi:hypothetical protein